VTRQAPRPANCGSTITAMTLAERLTVSYSDDDPFVMARHEELFL
jgi:hypothetical protein